MLSISPRPATIGKVVSAPKEEGGNSFREVSIELSELELDKAEVNQLMQDPHAWEKFFSTQGADDAIEPSLPVLKPLRLKSAIEQSTVVLTLGLQATAIRLAPCDLANITMTPREDGVMVLSLKIVARPDIDKKLLPIFGANDCDAEIHCSGYGDQQPLPLGNGRAEREGARL